MRGEGASAGQGPHQAAVGVAVQPPARSLVGEPVVVLAQAGEVVVRGRPVGVRDLVVEVAAAGADATAGEAAASIAQLRRSGGGGRWGGRPRCPAGVRVPRPAAAAVRSSVLSVSASSAPDSRSVTAMRGRSASAVSISRRASSSRVSAARAACAGRSARRRRSQLARRRPAPRPAARRGPPRSADGSSRAAHSVARPRRRRLSARWLSVAVGIRGGRGLGPGQQAEGVGQFADQRRGHEVAVDLAGARRRPVRARSGCPRRRPG